MEFVPINWIVNERESDIFLLLHIHETNKKDKKIEQRVNDPATIDEKDSSRVENKKGFELWERRMQIGGEGVIVVTGIFFCGKNKLTNYFAKKKMCKFNVMSLKC